MTLRSRASTSRSAWTWATVVPSVAGPRRPQDRVPLTELVENFRGTFAAGLHTHDDGSTHEHGSRPPRSRRSSTRPPRSRSRPATRRPTPSARGGRRAGARTSRAPAPAAAHEPRRHALPRGGGGPGRRAGQAALRLGGDRRHHLLHQHQQPQRHGGGRACWPGTPWRAACGRPAWVKTSLAPGSRAVTDYLEGAGLMDPLEAAGLRPGRLRLHDLHRQLRAAGRADRGGDRRRTIWSAWRSSPATATSRGASIRRRGPATSPRRRWSSPSPWPGASTST